MGLLLQTEQLRARHDSAVDVPAAGRGDRRHGEASPSSEARRSATANASVGSSPALAANHVVTGAAVRCDAWAARPASASRASTSASVGGSTPAAAAKRAIHSSAVTSRTVARRASGTVGRVAARSRAAQVMAVKRGVDQPPSRFPDAVVAEEPMQIRVDGVTLTTTMRTPGHDFELAAGFCWAEGALAGTTVRQIRYCATGSAELTHWNTVTVDTAAGDRGAAAVPRLSPTTAACGVCGVDDVAVLCERLAPVGDGPPRPLDLAVVAAVESTAKARQELFAKTGAVHAAAAFDLTTGDLVILREDIGRHNAVDKVVGRLLLDGILPAASRASDDDAPPEGLGLFVSGRASFEMSQKAWAAGFRWLVCVGGVSSLAIEVARRANLGLAGFLRAGSFTVYVPEEPLP